MIRAILKLDDRVKLTYIPASVDGKRRAIVVDGREMIRSREGCGTIEIEISGRDGMGVQLVELPIALLRGIVQAGGELLEDDEVRYQAQHVGPSSGAQLERYVRDALR